jgi:hypothetical protein
MDISSILSGLRPFVVGGANSPGLFRTMAPYASRFTNAGKALMGIGSPTSMGMMALPQMGNFGRAFDTSGDGPSSSPIVNDFQMLKGMPPPQGAPSLTSALDAYAAKLRSGAATSGVNPMAVPSATAAPTASIPLPQPRPSMPGQTVANVPMPQPNPLLSNAAGPDNNPYGFTSSPAYMGQGSTRPANGLFALAQMFKNSL